MSKDKIDCHDNGSSCGLKTRVNSPQSNMHGKAIDNSASGCLVIIFPLALFMAFLFVAWPVLLALLIAGAILRVWQYYQWQKWSQQVNPFFHKLLQENQGSVTAMDLAMKANLSGEAAKRYLEGKVEEFGAIAREYPDRGTVYYFVTSATLGSIFDESEPPSIYDELLTSGQSEEFVGADLAPTAKFESSPTAPNPPLHSDRLKEDSATQQAALSAPPPLPDSEQGDTVPTTQQFQEGEPEEKPTEKPKQSQGIIQSELARRLDVHSSTVHKRKFEPDFSEWSRSRDPQGIAWKYSARARLFFPLETEPQDT